MNLLLLSGNSKRGQEWLGRVDEQLSPYFDKTYCHDYKHWESGEPEINLAIEEERLRRFVPDLSPYMVFAKSAGTMLASKAIASGILRPQKCLFVGLPFIMIQNHNLPADKWLQATKSNITIMQHTFDPYGSYLNTKEFVDNLNIDNISVQELPGETHDYLEFALFADYFKNLTSQ